MWIEAKLIALAIMACSDQHNSNLTLALLPLVIVVFFVGVMINKLSIVIQMQNEILRVGDRAQARKIEGKE
jgi:hypothetical protein